MLVIRINTKQLHKPSFDASTCYVHLRHLLKRYKTFLIFLVKNDCFFQQFVSFLICFANFCKVFLHVLIFAVRAFWLISGVLTFVKSVEFRKSTVMGGRYFLIFQPIDMLNLSLNLNESQSMYAYKRYGYEKRVYLHSLQSQIILVVNYISLLCHQLKCKPFCS